MVAEKRGRGAGAEEKEEERGRGGGGEVRAEVRGEGRGDLHWRTDWKEVLAGRGERRRKDQATSKKEEGGEEGKKEKEKEEEENVSSVESRVTLPGSVNRREEEMVVVVEVEVLATSVEKLVTWQELALRRRGEVVIQ